MPGFLVHVGATVQCAHLGTAQPTAPVGRVMVSGQPITTIAAPYSVAACTNPAITSGAPPCATGQWTKGAARVFALGQPVVLLDSQATCTPTGTPLLIIVTQTRVTGI
jgi:hypothetical protein